jgi:methyl-accepting chemotaxis protein
VEQSHDFTLPPPQLRNDEVGQTGEAIVRLLETLRLTFNELLDTVSKVDLAAQEMSQASVSASQQSHVASDSASAMAAAIEEMTVSINHITESAAIAVDRAKVAGCAPATAARPSSAPPPRWPPSPTKCSAPRW